MDGENNGKAYEQMDDLGSKNPPIFGSTPISLTLPETNSSPLKMDGWNTTVVSFWDGLFSGAMLNFGRVIKIVLSFNSRVVFSAGQQNPSSWARYKTAKM